MGTGMLLSRAIEMFVIWRQADGISPHTITQNRLQLKLFLERLGDVDVCAVTKDDIVAFLAWLRTDYRARYFGRPTDHGLGEASASNYHDSLRVFWRWAHDELGAPDLVPYIPFVERTEEPIEPYSEDEVRRMVKASTFRDRPKGRGPALILLLVDTGLRIGEVCRLNVGDVNVQVGEVRVAKFGTGKKTRGRVVVMGSATRKAMARYLLAREALAGDAGLRSGDPLFLMQDGRRADRDGLYQLLRRIGARAGVQHVFCHRFRHTFALQYLRNGGDVFTLQRQMGHANLEMTRRYLDLVDADDEDVHRKASPADRWRL